MLTNLQLLALKSLPVKPVRDAVSPGVYPIDPFTVQVSGTMEVGADEEYTPTAEIPLIPVIALALKRMGVQREAFLRCLRAAVNEVLLQDKDMRSALLEEAGLATFEAEFRRKVLDEIPKKNRAGKIHARTLQVTEV